MIKKKIIYLVNLTIAKSSLYKLNSFVLAFLTAIVVGTIYVVLTTTVAEGCGFNLEPFNDERIKLLIRRLAAIQREKDDIHLFFIKGSIDSVMTNSHISALQALGQYHQWFYDAYSSSYSNGAVNVSKAFFRLAFQLSVHPDTVTASNSKIDPETLRDCFKAYCEIRQYYAKLAFSEINGITLTDFRHYQSAGINLKYYMDYNPNVAPVKFTVSVKQMSVLDYVYRTYNKSF